MQSNPRDIHCDELIAVSRGFVGFRALCGCFNDITGSTHTDTIIRRQVHLIIIAAPETRQDETAHFVGYLEFFPFTGFAFVMQNVTSDSGTTVIAVFPLYVDRIAAGAGRV